MADAKGAGARVRVFRVRGRVGLEVGGAARSSGREDDPSVEDGVSAELRRSRGRRRHWLGFKLKKEFWLILYLFWDFLSSC